MNLIKDCESFEQFKYCILGKFCGWKIFAVLEIFPVENCFAVNKFCGR